MVRASLFVALTALALSFVPARSQSLTGEHLLQLCADRSSAEWQNRGQWICPSYVRGVMDGIRLQAANTAGSTETYDKLLPICLPPGGSADEAIRIVVRAIEANPALRSRDTATIVFEALKQAWPCP